MASLSEAKNRYGTYNTDRDLRYKADRDLYRAANSVYGKDYNTHEEYNAAKAARRKEVQDVLAALYPDLRNEYIERNRAANEKVLNTLAFDMEPWTRDPVSQKGLRNLEFDIKVPFGVDGPDYLPGGTRGMTINDKEVVISGLPVQGDRHGSLPGLLRHEASHRALDVPDEEMMVRKADYNYARANGDANLAASAKAYMDDPVYRVEEPPATPPAPKSRPPVARPNMTAGEITKRTLWEPVKKYWTGVFSSVLGN